MMRSGLAGRVLARAEALSRASRTTDGVSSSASCVVRIGAQASARAPAAEAEDWRANAEAQADAAQGSGPVGDPLLQALVWLTQHHGRARSAESLRASVALDGGPLAPDQALRVPLGHPAGAARHLL